MADKNKVSQAVMDDLNLCRYKISMYKNKNIVTLLKDIPEGCELGKWIWRDSGNVPREQAVIDFVYNNADNFEVKTPKWVIVSKKVDIDGDWWFLILHDFFHIIQWDMNATSNIEDVISRATRIADPKLKDALLYAYKDFEAIEVEE